MQPGAWGRGQRVTHPGVHVPAAARTAWASEPLGITLPGARSIPLHLPNCGVQAPGLPQARLLWDLAVTHSSPPPASTVHTHTSPPASSLWVCGPQHAQACGLWPGL